MKRSEISWTDYSGGNANFVLRGKRRGDCEISPGCLNCYAHALRQRNPKATPDETTYSEAKLTALVKSKLKENGSPYRRGPGSKPMVFVVDMGDLFHANIPDDFILEAIKGMGHRPDIDFQILTKRVERMASLLGGVPDNVWLGVTIEDQRRGDERLPYLRQVKAKVRYVSIEPMLESVRLDLSGIHWVICGGESGSARRPFEKPWASNLWQQCRDANVPFFFKQGSAQKQGRDDTLNGQVIKQWPTV